MLKRIAILLVLVVLVLAITQPVLACTPPPNDWGCSPGFWKNHTDSQYWGPYGLNYNEYPDSHGLGLFEALTQKGWGDQVAKWAAVMFLNTNPYTDGSTCK